MESLHEDVSLYLLHLLHMIVMMCRALMPGVEDSVTDEALWETLPHFWVAISMVFFIAATIFTLLKITGDIGALGWWDLFINFWSGDCKQHWGNKLRGPNISRKSLTGCRMRRSYAECALRERLQWCYCLVGIVSSVVSAQRNVRIVQLAVDALWSGCLCMMFKVYQHDL